MEKKGNHTAAKASTASILSVAMVLFASHAGGGFATGNQENTYFVCSGWAGLLSLALSMAILTGIIAIAMRLYNKYDLHSYKELFEKLYHPFDKLELVFELFFTSWLSWPYRLRLPVQPARWGSTLVRITMSASFWSVCWSSLRRFLANGPFN